MYDCHYSEKRVSRVLVEMYADSSAHFAHMQADGHGEFMGTLMGLIDSVLRPRGTGHRNTPKPSRMCQEHSSTQSSQASNSLGKACGRQL